MFNNNQIPQYSAFPMMPSYFPQSDVSLLQILIKYRVNKNYIDNYDT